MNSRQRYREDATFKQAVDMFGAILDDVALTPSELREALMLALYIAEARNPGPWSFRVDADGNILPSEGVRRG